MGRPREDTGILFSLETQVSQPASGPDGDRVPARMQGLARARDGLTLKAPVAAYAKAVAGVVITVLVGAALRNLMPILSVTSLFLLPVVVSGLRWGLGPALVATALGVLAGTLFYEPVLSVQVWTLRDIIDLIVFSAVAIGLALMGDGLRRSAAALERKSHDLSRLYDLSRDVASARDAPTIMSDVASHLSRALGHEITVLSLGVAATTGAGGPPIALREAIPASLAEGAQKTLFWQTAEEGPWLLTALGQATGPALAIAARLPPGDAADPEALAKIRAMLEEGARSLERLGLAQAVEQRQLRARADEVRFALLDAASHEMRTPLSAVLGVVTALAQSPAVAADQRLTGLTTLAADECRRLDRVIQNLLDAGRIRSGTLAARLSPTEVSDLIQGALGQAHLRLTAHRVEATVPPGLPLVLIDPVLVEQALTNLLENAAKFSEQGTTIAISATQRDDWIDIQVADEGAGFADDEVKRLFGRFYRGERTAQVAGSGLGLSIARAFIEASGGTIAVYSEGRDRGARLTVSLPAVAFREDADNDI